MASRRSSPGVPFADNSLYPVPEGLSDEQVLFLADILPTGFEVGVLNGKVQPGDSVAIVGAGPVGLAATLTAKLFSPGRIIASTSPMRGCSGRGNSAPM
jgi:alcohol dehydrogenase